MIRTTELLHKSKICLKLRFYVLWQWKNMEKLKLNKVHAVLPTTFMIFSSNAATLFKIGVPAPSEVSWSWTASTKMSVLGHFLDFRKNVFRPRLRPLRVIHPWKAVDVQLLMQKTKNIFLNSLQFQIFGDAHGQTFHMT